MRERESTAVVVERMGPLPRQGVVNLGRVYLRDIPVTVTLKRVHGCAPQQHGMDQIDYAKYRKDLPQQRADAIGEKSLEDIYDRKKIKSAGERDRGRIGGGVNNNDAHR